MTTSLARRLTTGDAVFIGLGSMIGAGVFAVWAPAAQSAGRALLVGLAIAAIVAFCNASSSAQLAARYPTSGGSYVYGREVLGPWWGFVAGWSFVIGKIASCAAMALTFAAYAVPEAWQKPVAVVAVLLLALVNSRGVTRTALLARILVVAVLAILVVVVSVVVGGVALAGGSQHPLSLVAAASGPYGVLQAAGLLFFAFAGYARVATMGEEVRDPARSIPRAITIALAIVVVLYAVIALVLLSSLGVDAVAGSPAPLADAVRGPAPWAVPVVAVGAALASLGALLGLVAGVGRTSLAMARGADLPTWLAAVNPRSQVPARAELVIGIVVSILVLTIDLRSAIGFSSFGVLLYYAVANLSALRQPAAERRYPRLVSVIGLVGCVVLVATLPLPAIAVGLGVVAVGIVARLISRRVRGIR